MVYKGIELSGEQSGPSKQYLRTTVGNVTKWVLVVSLFGGEMAFEVLLDGKSISRVQYFFFMRWQTKKIKKTLTQSNNGVGAKHLRGGTERGNTFDSAIVCGRCSQAIHGGPGAR